MDVLCLNSLLKMTVSGNILLHNTYNKHCIGYVFVILEDHKGSRLSFSPLFPSQLNFGEIVEDSRLSIT